MSSTPAVRCHDPPPPLTPTAKAGPKPLTEGKQSIGILIGLWYFVVVPFLAVLAAIPFACGAAG